VKIVLTRGDKKMRRRSDEYLWKIIMEMYQKMYKKATPSANFKELMKTGEAKKDRFYMNYYLPKEMLDKIFDDVCKKYKASKREKYILKMNVYLGCSPTSVPPKKRKTLKKEAKSGNTCASKRKVSKKCKCTR
jgi:hypothetical protein